MLVSCSSEAFSTLCGDFKERLHHAVHNRHEHDEITLLEGKRGRRGGTENRNFCIKESDIETHPNLNGRGLGRNTFTHIVGRIYEKITGIIMNCLYTIPLCNFGFAFRHVTCVIVNKDFGKALSKTKSSPLFFSYKLSKGKPLFEFAQCMVKSKRYALCIAFWAIANLSSIY